MNGDTVKRAADSDAGLENDACAQPKLKKVCIDSLKDEAITGRLSDPQVVGKLKQVWNGELTLTDAAEDYDGGRMPYPFVEIRNILKNPQALRDLQDVVDYEEKISDLFHFNQSRDLLSLPDSHPASQIVGAFSSYFKDELLPAFKTITGIPLNDRFDIFASQYKIGDYLLCHDDELESRRIAFILYMSENYDASFGGQLDMYSSEESDEGMLKPGKIVRSLVPEFNKLVFFEVTAKSFHQVREVISEEADRRAISGWFYGEPVPRPVVLPMEPLFQPVNFLSLKEHPLDETVLSKSYTENETREAANGALSENSEIMLQTFFTAELYETITKQLDSLNDSLWSKAGPVNMQSFLELNEADENFPAQLRNIFRSPSFLRFLEELTEFPFASEPDLTYRCSLKKFIPGCYSLVRGKDRKLLNKSKAGTLDYSEDEDFEAEEEPDEEAERSGAEEEPVEIKEVNGTGESNGAVNNESCNANGDDGEAHTDTSGAGVSNGNVDASGTTEKVLHEINGGAQQAGPSKVLLSETAEEDVSDEEYQFMEDSGSEKEEPEPNRVDVMFFVTPTIVSGYQDSPETIEENKSSESSDSCNRNQEAWKEQWGGSKVYTDDLTGNQLVKINPIGNGLAIVVRDESISSHYSYINCKAGSHYFYSFELEFNFPTSAVGTAQHESN